MAVVQSAHAYAAHMHFRETSRTRVAAQADFGLAWLGTTENVLNRTMRVRVGIYVKSKNVNISTK